MITCKADLREYLECDRIALGYKKKKPAFRDIVWKYEIYLRKSEYYTNVKGGLLHRMLRAYNVAKWNFYGLLCGFSIGLNCFGKGLSISHMGTIVVNHSARIGENCRLHVCTNIGTGSPAIGNNVYIGPGVKIFGAITVADNIRIGANAVVNKDFLTPGVTIVGVPAKEVKKRNKEQ